MMVELKMHVSHKRFPEALHFILDSPIRKLLSPPEQLISRLDVGPKDVVVDFGCGTGFFTVHLARIVGRTIGIDVSPKMLKRAREIVKKSGVTVEFLESDGTDIELKNHSVDLVLLVHVFHEAENRLRVLREFFRILNQKGRLVIVEKTSGIKRFAGILGPPIVELNQVIQEIERADFELAQTISVGNESMIIARKRRCYDPTVNASI